MEELIHIDNLCNKCGFFTSDTMVNGGYGCNHKDCGDGEYVHNGDVIDRFEACRIVAMGFTARNIRCNRRLAKKFLKKARLVLDKDYKAFGVKFQGVCFASVCPLGYLAEREDFIRFGEEPDCMSEGEWVVIENQRMKEKGD